MTNTNPDASGPDLLGRLWYADPTGETAVRNILALSRGDEFAVVDSQGNPIFFIKKHVLAEAVIPQLTFTRTRRGRDNIRAHMRNAPGSVGADIPGAEPKPTRQ